MILRDCAAAAALGCVLVIFAGCATQPRRDDAMTTRTESTNPLLAPWTGPYGGGPPFGRFETKDPGPARDAAMAENLAQIDAIAANPDPPTFDNAIAAMERAGKPLQRVTAIYGIYTSTMNDAEVQTIESEMAP